MNNPQDFSLCGLSLGSAITGAVQNTISSLNGLTAVTIEASFLVITLGNGSTCTVWIQTSVDGGTTWIDIACLAFGTASAKKVINLSGLTAVTTPITPTDAGLGTGGRVISDATVDGILGSTLRAKVTSTGTFTSATLSVKGSPR
jgi:hypothetical protein